MKKIVIAVVVIGTLAAGVMYFRSGDSAGSGATEGAGQAGGAAGGNGRGGGRRGGGAGGFGGGGQFGRPPMTVELGRASRASIKSEITVEIELLPGPQ